MIQANLIARGFALPNVVHRVHTEQHSQQNQAQLIIYRVDQSGYYAELHQQLLIQIPRELKSRFQLSALVATN